MPEDMDALWLPGGYPELFARRLNENAALRKEIKAAVKAGLPLIAECGGFMYLHDRMEDMHNNAYEMCGVIAGSAFKTEKLCRFGYIDVVAKKDTLLLRKNQRMRGHEFHYFDSTANGNDALATKANGSKSWECIHGDENTFVGFPHIYFGTNRHMLQNLTKACKKFRKERENGGNGKHSS